MVVAWFFICEVLVVRNIEGLSGCVLWLSNVLFKWSFFEDIVVWMNEEASKKLPIQLANALHSSQFDASNFLPKSTLVGSASLRQLNFSESK